jgi:LmbE family N-acetylglucosaminyl deacetylase
VSNPPPSILAVMAHPDDEVLGCGATLAKMATAGHSVHACFLSGNADARNAHPGSAAIRAQAHAAQQALGIQQPIFGSFPNIKLNTVPHLDLVRYVEDVMRTVQATILFTHHPADVNDDHRHTSLACQAAARLSQRGGSVPHLEAVYFVEVLSSTDWSLDLGSLRFAPTTFCEISEEGLTVKLEALQRYDGVMRDYPHPRSEAAVRALAVLRGAEAGLDLAEAFQVGYSTLRFG